ncbi:hypothetical protein SEA_PAULODIABOLI_308 [Microbacterium phage PauloDiaboli]|nr:hypothetical protein SEA_PAULODIABOLI_308 [Microbacterium phage PauloDiaboli]QWY84115.1 hypothetical protein SEA_A3WALLY_308 [Microbacterium phage A3Wally]
MIIFFIVLIAVVIGLIAWGVDGRFKIGAAAASFAGLLAVIVALIVDYFV